MQKSSDNLRIRMARIEAALDMDPASCGAPTTCTTTHNRLHLRLRRKTSTCSNFKLESGASGDTSTSSDSGIYSPPSPHYPSSRTSSRTGSEAATGTASLRQHVNDVMPLAQVRHGVVTGSGRLLLPPFRGVGDGPRGGSSNKHDTDSESESNSKAPIIIVLSPRRHATAVTQAVTVTRLGGRGASESGLAPALDSESESDLESSSYSDSDSAADNLKVLVVPVATSPQADLNAQLEQGADLMLLTGVSTGSESRPSLHTNTIGTSSESQESEEAPAAAPLHDVPMLHLPVPKGW